MMQNEEKPSTIIDLDKTFKPSYAYSILKLLRNDLSTNQLFVEATILEMHSLSEFYITQALTAFMANDFETFHNIYNKLSDNMPYSAKLDWTKTLKVLDMKDNMEKSIYDYFFNLNRVRNLIAHAFTNKEKDMNIYEEQKFKEITTKFIIHIQYLKGKYNDLVNKYISK